MDRFYSLSSIWRCIQKFPDGRLERELQMIQPSATRCSYIAIWWVSLVSFSTITLYVAFQWVFIVIVVYFVIDSVRKLLDTPSTWYQYKHSKHCAHHLPSLYAFLYSQQMSTSPWSVVCLALLLVILFAIPFRLSAVESHLSYNLCINFWSVNTCDSPVFLSFVCSVLEMELTSSELRFKLNLFLYRLWEIPQLIRINFVRFEVLMTMKIQVVVCWVVMPCSGVVGWKMEVEKSFICWYPTTSLHGVTPQKTLTWSLILFTNFAIWQGGYIHKPGVYMVHYICIENSFV
jgi:hypothetical protein